VNVPLDLPPAFQDFLDSLEGIAYAVDRTGTILAVSRESWSDFARENEGDAIAVPNAVIGQNLLASIAGEEVRQSYRDYMETLSEAGGSERGAFGYRCDAPERMRQMRMAISPLVFDGVMHGFLFHSVVWEEAVRPAIALYDFSGLLERMERESGQPHLSMCSYCQRVRHPAGTEAGEWVEATEYYRRGGDEQVVISHGICPDCRDRMRARTAGRRREGREKSGAS